jgi:hypothetical protein
MGSGINWDERPVPNPSHVGCLVTCYVHCISFIVCVNICDEFKNYNNNKFQHPWPIHSHYCYKLQKQKNRLNSQQLNSVGIITIMIDLIHCGAQV